MMADAKRALAELVRRRAEFGDQAAAAKVAALQGLERARLGTAREVLALHEALCFLAAYPDDGRVLDTVRRMLIAFERRPDLRRHRKALANSGIAGTETSFPFFAATAAWLARRHPGHLRVDWSAPPDRDAFERLLPRLALDAEMPGIDEVDFTPREWLRRMKGSEETDAEFLIRRIASLPWSEVQREMLYDMVGVSLVLSPGLDVPSRTLEWSRWTSLAAKTISMQTRPLDRSRPDLHRAARRRPRAIESLPLAAGQRMVDLAREAMVSRARDLDAFCYGDPRDVRRVRWEDGLEFAVIGVIPERRLVLESVYAYLTLKNGVPIGYVLVSALFGSSEVAYNVFETWRGAEAAPIYARALATTRALFGSDTFTIMPYQLGAFGNEEGIQSGAWWFYRKLGFEPRDAKAVAMVRDEEKAIARRPSHRSSPATLRALAQHNLFFPLGRRRDDVIGTLDLSNVGLHVTRFLSANFGSDRERARRACVREAAARLGARVGPGERVAWERWSPLVLILPGIARWSVAERRALAAVIRAKAGPRESEFVRRFDAHRALRRAIATLAHDALA